MAVRKVITYPDPILKQKAAPAQLSEVDDLIADLVDTMRANERCVGLAAPQIGVPARVAVVDVTGHPHAKDSHGLVVMVNPQVVEVSEGSKVGREGCLSLPDLTANVRRPRRAVIDTGNDRIEVRSIEARCLLHELDHLEGILFLDRVASLTDDLFRRGAPTGSSGASGA
jgi:peptide deformylase